MNKRCAFVTFGCKINFYDTQAIREAIRDLGYEEGPPGDDTDLLVVNSCTVTDRAGGKSVSAVRRLARRHPAARILVTGCLSDDDRTALAKIEGVEHVIGNEEKDQIPALVQGAALDPVRDRRSRSIFNLEASRFDHQTRAYLKVHDGCDSFCTYCIIPFLRGKSKSRPVAQVRAEAERFAMAGHRELVLTGIHLSQYGKDLRDGTDLVELLVSLREIAGIDRVRLSSIGEGAFSDRLLAAFEADPGLCPFFHIPIQSGSDGVLQRMRRDYTVSEYLAAVDRVRAHLPRAVVATDLMVGFPGETDVEFDESLATCRRAGFAKMHIFPYSPRGGTRAVRFEGRVSPEVMRERLGRARALEAELILEERQRWLGRRVEVLVERQSQGRARGQSREGLETRFDCGPRDLQGREVEVAVEGFRGTVLEGALR